MDNYMDFNENKVASWGKLKNYVLHTDATQKEAVHKLYDNIKLYAEKSEVVIPKLVIKAKTQDLS